MAIGLSHGGLGSFLDVLYCLRARALVGCKPGILSKVRTVGALHQHLFPDPCTEYTGLSNAESNGNEHGNLNGNCGFRGTVTKYMVLDSLYVIVSGTSNECPSTVGNNFSAHVFLNLPATCSAL